MKVATPNTFFVKYYTGEESLLILPRLQSIITENENNSNTRGQHPLNAKGKNIASVFSMAGNILGITPKANPNTVEYNKQDCRINLSVVNKSDAYFIPTGCIVHSDFKVQENLSACSPGQEASQSFTYDGEKFKSDHVIQQNFMLSFDDKNYYSGVMKIINDNKRWYVSSLSLYAGATDRSPDDLVSIKTLYSPSSNDLKGVNFMRVACNDNSSISFGLAVTSSDPYYKENNIRLTLTPWFSKADSVL